MVSANWEGRAVVVDDDNKEVTTVKASSSMPGNVIIQLNEKLSSWASANAPMGADDEDTQWAIKTFHTIELKVSRKDA